MLMHVSINKRSILASPGYGPLRTMIVRYHARTFSSQLHPFLQNSNK